MEHKDRLTKYELARMLGARSLQIAMGAPFLVKLSKEDLERLHYNPIEIAKLELEKGVLPLSVKRPAPKHIEASEKAPMEVKA